MDQILDLIAKYLGVSIEQELSMTDIQKMLAEKNTMLTQLLQEYKQASDAYEFLKKDHELRYKMPDIWKLQCDSAMKSTEKTRQQLLQQLTNSINDD